MESKYHFVSFYLHCSPWCYKNKKQKPKKTKNKQQQQQTKQTNKQTNRKTEDADGNTMLAEEGVLERMRPFVGN